MNKALKITFTGILITLLTAPLSAKALMQEMICYKNGNEGIVVKTRYEVIKDFCHGIRYKKIQVKP